jgi:hypothetical protein
VSPHGGDDAAGEEKQREPHQGGESGAQTGGQAGVGVVGEDLRAGRTSHRRVGAGVVGDQGARRRSRSRCVRSDVYAVRGNKAGLALGLVDSINVVADVPGLLARLQAAEGRPVEQLAAVGAFQRRILESGVDVIVLMREAHRAEPDLAAAYDEGRARGSEMRQRVFGSWPEGTLREGYDAAEARAVRTDLLSGAPRRGGSTRSSAR